MSKILYFQNDTDSSNLPDFCWPILSADEIDQIY